MSAHEASNGDKHGSLLRRHCTPAGGRDELGITETLTARPLQAAGASALSFALGAAMPVAAVLVVPEKILIPAVAALSIVCLAVLGAWGAKQGGAPVMEGAIRVTFWGALAMAATAAVGMLFGVRV